MKKEALQFSICGGEETPVELEAYGARGEKVKITKLFVKPGQNSKANKPDKVLEFTLAGSIGRGIKIRAFKKALDPQTGEMANRSIPKTSSVCRIWAEGLRHFVETENSIYEILPENRH